MEVSIPQNVRIDKDDLPKGWSYPLKSTDLIVGLTLASIGAEVDLVFSNSIPRSYPGNPIKYDANGERVFDRLSLASIAFYGARCKQSAAFKHKPRFLVTTQVVPHQHRQKLVKVICLEMFPTVLKWMKRTLADPHREHTRTVLNIDYNDKWNLTGTDHKLKKYLTASVEGEILWHKEFELGEEENVKETQ